VTPTPTILDLLPAFGLGAPSWSAWRAILAAIFALPMSGADLEAFRGLTALEVPPTQPVRECWIVAGRRAGKSRIAAATAVYLATCRAFGPVLAPGEHGTVMLLAADKKQARTVLRYINGILDRVPPLRGLIESRTREAVHLKNRISIEVHTSSFRSVRGYTIVAAICDEIAFWPTDTSANPDVEVISALRPAMATVPYSLLLCISSPYSRRGTLWSAYQAHYGKPHDRVLVVQAPTLALNPTADAEIIRSAYEDDEPSASAEYGAQFRRDLERFVASEVVDAVTLPGRFELPPVAGVQYSGFVDPSGGSQDSMTLAIAHAEGEVAVLDVVREVRPPFSPEQVTAEFCGFLAAYRIRSVCGDRYGGEWPREQFRKHGTTYEPAELSKSDIYLETLPLLNAGRVQLLDLPRLRAQLVGLERRVGRGGRDSVDHAPGAHDDLINAALGALLLASEPEPARLEVW
jgi:hypothetical protein